jgi:hypothetical protein
MHEHDKQVVSTKRVPLPKLQYHLMVVVVFINVFLLLKEHEVLFVSNGGRNMDNASG